MAQPARKYNNKFNQKYNNNDSTDSQKTEVKNVLFYALVLCALCLLLIFYVSQNMRIMQLNTEVDSLHNSLESVQEENHQLKLTYSQKTSPARVERLARERLNMVEPGSTQTLVLNSTEPKDISPLQSSDDQFFLVQFAGDLWDKFNVVRADSPQLEDNMNE